MYNFISALNIDLYMH